VLVLHALEQLWLKVTVQLETALTNRHALVMHSTSSIFYLQVLFH
jgi:hypothetical protein